MGVVCSLHVEWVLLYVHVEFMFTGKQASLVYILSQCMNIHS